MTRLGVADAARRVGKSRKTLYRHIDQGRLSATKDCDGATVVDVSELIRVYGELLPEDTGTPQTQPGAVRHDETTETLRRQLAEREARIAELARDNEALRQDRDAIRATLDTTLRLIEDKRQDTQKRGFLARLFGV